MLEQKAVVGTTEKYTKLLNYYEFKVNYLSNTKFFISLHKIKHKPSNKEDLCFTSQK